MDSDSPEPADDTPSGATRTGPDVEAGVPSPAGAGTWGDLRLLGEIGRGAFGRVYRAWDETLAREVALKIIRPRDEAHRAAVLREGQMLARISHRNVVTVFRAQEIGGDVGLTMELIRGRHLSDLVRQGGPMGAEEAAVIGIHLCHALAAVHGAGLLHRDVKAHNVMRESGGRIVLMDFGAGRELVLTAPPEGAELSGTPLYLAPELFAGQPASPASDLYSLGVLLFYLVTRTYPVYGTRLSDLRLMHGLGQRRLLSDVRPDLPPAFVRVVERALARSPQQRFQTAGAMLADLADAMPGALPRPAAPLAGDVVVPAPPVPRAFSPARIAMAIGGVAIAAGVLGLLTSAHYNRALGRAGAFSDDTVLTWFVIGFRSIVPPFVFTLLFLVIGRVIAAVWHFAQRLIPPARRVGDLTRTTISGTLERLTGSDAATAAQGLLLVQVLAVALIGWFYRDLIATLPVLVNEAEPGALNVLDPQPSNGLLYSYGAVTSVLLASMWIGWHRLIARSGPLLPRGTVVAGVGLMVIVLLLIQLPYRLFYQSEAEQVTFKDQICFVTGSRDEDRLLYCPTLPKHQRTPIVKSSDVGALNSRGEIFARPADANRQP
jgi:serine/threonine-protein kinase